MEAPPSGGVGGQMPPDEGGSEHIVLENETPAILTSTSGTGS